MSSSPVVAGVGIGLLVMSLLGIVCVIVSVFCRLKLSNPLVWLLCLMSSAVSCALRLVWWIDQLSLSGPQTTNVAFVMNRISWLGSYVALAFFTLGLLELLQVKYPVQQNKLLAKAIRVSLWISVVAVSIFTVVLIVVAFAFCAASSLQSYASICR